MWHLTFSMITKSQKIGQKVTDLDQRRWGAKKDKRGQNMKQIPFKI